MFYHSFVFPLTIIVVVAIIEVILYWVIIGHRKRKAELNKPVYTPEASNGKLYTYTTLYDEGDFIRALWEAVTTIAYTLTKYHFNPEDCHRLDDIIAKQLILWIDEYGSRYRLKNPRISNARVRVKFPDGLRDAVGGYYSVVTVDIDSTNEISPSRTVRGVIDAIYPCYSKTGVPAAATDLCITDESIKEFYRSLLTTKTSNSILFHPYKYNIEDPSELSTQPTL